MKFNYYPETDSLYIDFSEKPSAESREITEGVVADYDDAGQLVGLDIDRASRITNLSQFQLSGFTPMVEPSNTTS